MNQGSAKVHNSRWAFGSRRKANVEPVVDGEEQEAGAVPTQKQRRREAVTSSQLSRVWLYATCALVLGGFILNSAPLFGLGVLLGAALGISWLWAYWSLHNITVKRQLSHRRAFWGEEVDMAQVFTNAKPLPVPWMMVEDDYPSGLQVTGTAFHYSERPRMRQIRTALSLAWYERVTKHYTIKCLARGEHSFGPVAVQTGDIFGLFRRDEQFATPEQILVYPRYVPVEHLGLPARQPFGEFKAIQHLATDPLRIRGVREYAYGDNPRYIHWKATARRGELQTKLFEPAATPQLFIFCNQDTFTRMWEGLDPASLELTITVAASLANHALQERYMVGVQVNSFSASSDRQVKLQPSRDPEQFTRILESLARIRGWSGLPMEDLIRAERRAMPMASTIVVVTAVVTEDLLDVLLALRRAGHPVTLVETIGSRRALLTVGHASGDMLEAQGIRYYQVEAVGGPMEIERITF